MDVAGHMDNLVYARLNGKQFKAVNTAKGPWSLLDALEDTGKTYDTNVDPKRHHMLVPTRASEERVSTSNLTNVTEIIREAAISFIGPDNFEGKVFALCINQQGVR